VVAGAARGILGPELKFGDYPVEYEPGKYLFASPQTMGPYAPLGVQCDSAEFFSGGCLTRLQDWIEETGGSYFAG
jgi:hypothetical protein